MNHEDKVQIEQREYVSEYDGKTYIEAIFTIKELYGYGVIIFRTPLVVTVSIEKGTDKAYYYYDFGMEDRVSVARESNFLYNYGDINSNKECDPIKTVFNTIKYDLQHAFNHVDIDPNFGHTHWALRSILADRVIAYDWWEEEDMGQQMEFKF